MENNYDLFTGIVIVIYGLILLYILDTREHKK